MTAIIIKGQDELIQKLKKVSNPLKFLDVVVRDVALRGQRDLVVNTPKKTGNAARSWTAPRKVSDSNYVVQSDLTTADKKHALMRILSEGRGEVRPVSKKMLYIPLTNKGRSKPLGAPISKDLEFGVDYVLAKKAAPYKGTKFIEKSGEKSSKELEQGAINEVKKLHG